MNNKKKITNKVIHGNCLEELPYIAKILGNKMIVVTDPPFNIGYHYNSYNDNLKVDEYYNMLEEVFSYSPFVVIHYPEEIYKIAFQVGLFPEKVVSWVYNSNTAKQHRDIAFFGIKPDFRGKGSEYKNPTDKRIAKRIADGKKPRMYDWWNINQVKNISKDKTEHPCQMPLEVMENIIKLIPEDFVIVDPFGGAGTTALACKNLKRNYVIIEQDKKYVDIIKKRLN